MFSKFCNCTGLDSKKLPVSFQKFKSLGTVVAFRGKIMIKKNKSANNITITKIYVFK